MSALVVAAVFAVASIFSSQVTKSAGNEVLIVSPTCGFWTFNASITGEVFQWDLKTLNESITAANYANTCYGTGNGDSPLCDTYIVPEVCVFAVLVQSVRVVEAAFVAVGRLERIVSVERIVAY